MAKIETAKEHLRKAWYAYCEIKRLSARIGDKEASIYGIGSPSNMNPDRVQSSMSGDALPRFFAEIDELNAIRRGKIIALERLREDIATEIEEIDTGDGVKDQLYKDVLHGRYVMFKKWERIAEDIDKTVRYVYILHGEALKAFEDVLNDNHGHGQADA